MAGFRVLLVEDDEVLAGTYKAGLEEDGFDVDVVSGKRDGFRRATNTVYQVLVVDLMLPDGSGVDLIVELRRVGVSTPILVVTARGDTATTVAALNRGADAYVVKPVAMAAVGARLRALHRRAAGAGEVLRVADLDFEPSRLLAKRGGEEIDLTPVQARLLDALMRHEGSVLTRTQLSDRVWPDGDFPASNALDVHVRALRSKIDDPFPTPLIETVRGMGYRLKAANRG